MECFNEEMIQPALETLRENSILRVPVSPLIDTPTI